MISDRAAHSTDHGVQLLDIPRLRHRHNLTVQMLYLPEPVFPATPEKDVWTVILGGVYPGCYEINEYGNQNKCCQCD